MLERQMNVSVPTFIEILTSQAYCKHNISLKLEKPRVYWRWRPPSPLPPQKKKHFA